MPGRLPIRREMSLALALLLAWTLGAAAQQRSALAPPPAWSELEAYQETITRDEFARLLEEVYAPRQAARELIVLGPESAVITTALEPLATWTLRFAASAAVAKPVPRHWRTPAELGPAPEERPLQGARIALDPGHLGGTWAKMEARFFQIGESRPVAEGDMTLRVAQMLAPRLEALGAEVQLVRSAEQPVTPLRPTSLRTLARQLLTNARDLRQPANPIDVGSDLSVRDQSELLFYRVSEIRERARVVNDIFKPDLTLCLHFNAEEWGNPSRPDFVPRNHLHILLNGCYSAGELRLEDVRFDMLVKLLSRCYPQELAAGAAAVDGMVKATQLPPYRYTTPNALAVSTDGYLWARNLLANRLYRTPVVYFEPYVMNSEVVWARVQAGDYDGEYLIAGAQRKSIYREYADGIVEGLRAYYRAERLPVR